MNPATEAPNIFTALVRLAAVAPRDVPPWFRPDVGKYPPKPAEPINLTPQQAAMLKQWGEAYWFPTDVTDPVIRAHFHELMKHQQQCDRITEEAERERVYRWPAWWAARVLSHVMQRAEELAADMGDAQIPLPQITEVGPYAAGGTA